MHRHSLTRRLRRIASPGAFDLQAASAAPLDTPISPATASPALAADRHDDTGTAPATEASSTAGVDSFTQRT